METIDISRQLAKVAEISPPIEEQWFIHTPFSNLGWVKVLFPEKSPFAYPLRPGATMAIDPAYIGDIQMGLGWPGTVTPENAIAIFYNSSEQDFVNSSLNATTSDSEQ